MNREKTFDSIPIDLFLEIFSRLPAKSVGRSRCVSKQWASILGCQDFTELFLTRSLTRPRLLFAVKPYISGGEWLFYSSPQPHNLYKKSIVVAADFHTKFPSGWNYSYASGLFCFPDVRRISKSKGEDAAPVICNPSTGQYAILPKLRMVGETRNFLGFDPIDKQFKVLFMNTIVNDDSVHYIMTIGAGKMRWRKIQYCLSPHKALDKGICINGVLYYLVRTDETSYVIVWFDVKSEKFKFVDAKCHFDQLINYKGKLCGINLYYASYKYEFPFKLCMWVLEDVEKQEWSKYVYTVRDESKVVEVDGNPFLVVVGMTATGDIVLAEKFTSRRFYVFYFNPERNTLQRVKIQGVEDYGSVYVFVDHVEDLNVNDTKQLMNSNVYAHLKQDLRTFETINRFDALCLSDDD